MNNFLNSVKVALSKEGIGKVPGGIGIYLFTHGSKIVYIGKSINIKARLLSHLENARVDRKEKAILDNSNSIEYVITDSEFKALLLESKLIQTHHPRYNVRWRDDKSYLYIKITVKEPYPKLFLVRKEREKGAEYFGPFPSLQSAQEILRQTRRIFPFCTQKKIGKPCFYSKIGLCSPCPSYIESINNEGTKNKLKKKYKKNIQQIRKILKGKTDSVEKQLIEELDHLTQKERYEEAIQVRNRLLRFQKLISQQLFDPQDFKSYDRSKDSIKDLLNILHYYLPNLKSLSRIECYDISNLSQKEGTGSMVVMTDGQVNKNEYKKFKIRNPRIFSDFEMLEEVLTRRFKNNWEWPNLIVVDGGKPQVRTVLKILHSLDKEIPVIGIAKRPDRLIIGIADLPTIRPNMNRPGFNLIRLIRDESHRFARKYHLYLRDKKLYNKI